MSMFSSIFASCFGAPKEKKSVDMNPSHMNVATPLPDETVKPKVRPSILSSDFESRRAGIDAKFAAFQEGMRKREEQGK